jgi:phthalate 4,5-dioxygenase oxygenase subunit
VRAGGTPAGVAPSYYDLYCALQVLPRDADWRQILAPAISPEKILQTAGMRVTSSSSPTRIAR